MWLPVLPIQVLTNLLSNALKFTEEGEMVIRVSAVPIGEHRGRGGRGSAAGPGYTGEHPRGSLAGPLLLPSRESHPALTSPTHLTNPRTPSLVTHSHSHSHSTFPGRSEPEGSSPWLPPPSRRGLGAGERGRTGGRPSRHSRPASPVRLAPWPPTHQLPGVGARHGDRYTGGAHGAPLPALQPRGLLPRAASGAPASGSSSPSRSVSLAHPWPMLRHTLGLRARTALGVAVPPAHRCHACVVL